MVTNCGNCLLWAPLGSGPAHRPQPLPADLGWKILRNQFVIEGPQLLDIRALVALGIEVVRIESSNPLEHFLVPAVHEVLMLCLDRMSTRLISSHPSISYAA